MINILFCGNKGVFDGILTSMLSILKRTRTKEPFSFYLFTMDLSEVKDSYLPLTEEQANILSLAAKKYNEKNEIILTDVSDIYKRTLLGCPNESAYCSAYTLIRLLADLVPNMPQKLLYLDVDVMFNRDVRLLYKIDISGYEYAGARDHYGKYLISPNYLNAGVILFNMSEARKTNLFEKARGELIRKKLVFADQSALIRATSKRKMLPQKFNDQKFLHKSTVVRHFSKRLFWLPYPHTDNIKQWHTDKIRSVFGYSEFDDILSEYEQIKLNYKEKDVTTNAK